MNLKPGDRLGDWIVERALGAGGMGSVYRCHSVLSEDLVAAVKVLTPSNLSDVEGRFVQEMRTLAQLNHPAIVRVLGGGRDEDRGLLYMAMELIDGEDLEARLRRGPITGDEVRSVFAPIADALAYAHDRGVAHRDIKPGNLMLRKDGTPVIVDFGIAVVSGQTRHTTEGMVPGTLVYLPPELFEGEPPDAVSTDAYALGVVLWESLTGRQAFGMGADSSQGQQMATIMGLKLRAEALDPGPDVSEGVREAVLRTTEPDPDERLVDLATVRELVGGTLDTSELAPRRTTRRNRRGQRRSWVLPVVAGLVSLSLILVAGAVAVASGAGLIGAWLYWDAAEPPPPPPVALDRALGRVASATAAGDLVEARVHAGRALDDHPEDPHANLAYGQILLAEGQLLLARPYLCAAVAGGLGAKVPGHAEGQLDCTRGPGASLPLTSPVALAQLDVTAAVADLSSLAAARQGDATASEESYDDAELEEESAEPMPVRAPAPTRRRSRTADAPTEPIAVPDPKPKPKPRSAPPAPAPAPEPAASAPPPPAPADPEGPALDEGASDGVGGAGYGGNTSLGEKSTRTPAVSQTGLEISGPLDEAIVKRLLRRYLQRIESCYERELAKDPSLSGRLALRLVIGADGTMASVQARRDTVGGGLAACVTSQLERMRSPTAEGPTTVTVTWTFESG